MTKNILPLLSILTVAGIVSTAFLLRVNTRSPVTEPLTSLSPAGDQALEESANEPQIPFRQIIIDRDFLRYPHCKSAGDFNNDGFDDLVVASAFGQGLIWYAYPSWSKHQIDQGSYSTDMQVVDVDGDGDADVIIPKLGTGLVWYENNSVKNDPVHHPWKLHVISGGASISGKDNFHHDVETGDVNGDGKLDVVTRGPGQTRIFFQRRPDSLVMSITVGLSSST